MKKRLIISLLFVMTVAGCKAPTKPAMTDDTLVTHEVNGVTLTHRNAVSPPAEFTPVNAAYRALYPASLMTRPDFSGKVVRTLETGSFSSISALVREGLRPGLSRHSSVVSRVPSPSTWMEPPSRTWR